MCRQSSKPGIFYLSITTTNALTATFFRSKNMLSDGFLIHGNNRVWIQQEVVEEVFRSFTSVKTSTPDRSYFISCSCFVCKILIHKPQQKTKCRKMENMSKNAEAFSAQNLQEYLPISCLKHEPHQNHPTLKAHRNCLRYFAFLI